MCAFSPTFILCLSFTSFLYLSSSLMDCLATVWMKPYSFRFQHPKQTLVSSEDREQRNLDKVHEDEDAEDGWNLCRLLSIVNRGNITDKKWHG